MKKRILVLGAGGMAGSMIYNYLNSLDKYNISCTSRAPVDNIFSIQIDIEKDMKVLEKKITEFDIVINCIGILVKESEIDLARTIYINSLFPHLLESLTKDTPTKIIHLSTDCIFKGDITGKYSEDDLPTETNWYGRSKALGELKNGKDLTLRMSIIGPQLKDSTSLFQWIITTKEKTLQGFDKVYWNGITTLELVKQIDRIIDTNLTGIYHLVPGCCISKGDLIRLINEIFDCEKLIESNNELHQNKVLMNNRIKEYDPKILGYRIQLEELKAWMRSHG